jgi:surfeit locus 1 family protein
VFPDENEFMSGAQSQLISGFVKILIHHSGTTPASDLRSCSLEFSIIKLTIRFNWKAAFTVALTFCILVALGFWQLDRAEEKRRKQLAIEARLIAKPVAFEDLLQNTSESLNLQRVYLQGSYLVDRTILLTNKFYLGQRGYEVLTAFKLKSINQIVMVSRGWTDARPGPNGPRNLETPAGEHHLIGAIHVPSGPSFFTDEPIKDDVWPLRLHHLSMDNIDRLFSVPVFPYVVRLDETMPGVLHRYWPVPDLHPERSTSYAVQWFSMAILLIVVTLFNCTNIAEMLRSRRE